MYNINKTGRSDIIKCYICNTEMVMSKVIHNSEEIPVFKCPQCNDDYTTIIHTKDLKEVDSKVKAYMEYYDCTKEEAEKEIAEIEQQMINDFYGYSKYTGEQY